MSGHSYSSPPLTVAEAVVYYQYSLQVGASWSHERGNKKINCRPTTIRSLLVNLNNASSNAARNGCGDTYVAEESIQTA